MKKYWGTIKQFIQYNIVGIVNTAVDFFVFTLLTEVLHVVYLPAKVISYSCGLVNSYILNTTWTFRRERKRSRREMLLFVLVNLVALAVSLLAMYVCRTVLMIESNLLCNLIATPLSLVVNFTGNKLFVFKEKTEERRVK